MVIKIPIVIKRLLNPWSRVPPSAALKYIPRILGLRTQKLRLKELNEKYPPIRHEHISTYIERWNEIGAGQRIRDKWKVKPYALTFESKNSENLDSSPNATVSQDKRTGGIFGVAFNNRDIRAFWWLHSRSSANITLPDRDFPIPSGRIILKWLYDRHLEPCCFQRTQLPSDNQYPQFYPCSWAAPSAILFGNVILVNHSSVREGSILKADHNYIYIGSHAHVMEGCVLTTSPPTEQNSLALGAVTIDAHTIVGPNCRLHGCDIGFMCSIGSGCTIRYGAKIGDHCIIASGSVVEEDQYIPEGEIWGGSPARFIRAVGDGDKYQCLAESEDLHTISETYRHDENFLGTTWTEYEQVCAEVESAVRDAIKGKIGEAAQLPPSLSMLLLKSLPIEEHPNPEKTVAERVRGMFNSRFANNLFPDQRPVFTGNYNQHAMTAGMN